jgi:hypothetical protein
MQLFPFFPSSGCFKPLSCRAAATGVAALGRGWVLVPFFMLPGGQVVLLLIAACTRDSFPGAASMGEGILLLADIPLS